jgi:hypothetical protein
MSTIKMAKNTETKTENTELKLWYIPQFGVQVEALSHDDAVVLASQNATVKQKIVEEILPKTETEIQE